MMTATPRSGHKLTAACMNTPGSVKAGAILTEGLAGRKQFCGTDYSTASGARNIENVFREGGNDDIYIAMATNKELNSGAMAAPDWSRRRQPPYSTA
ncbi:hypothetical protein GCM10027321_09340 [Massilia terrae]